MSEENSHINFTAADIEKYHRHQLSPKEMHELEKAALDDPFLADALEGYAVAGVNAAADMTDLKNRLTKKTEDTKTVPLIIHRRSNFLWLRVAAIIIIVVGAGLLVYQLSFNKNSVNIAQAESKKSEEKKATDSGSISAPVTTKADTAVTETTGQQQKDNPVIGNDKIAPGKITTTQSNGRGLIQTDSAAIVSRNFSYSTNPATSVPVKESEEKKKPVVLNQDNPEKNAVTAFKKEAKAKATDDRKDADGLAEMNKHVQQPAGYYKTNEGFVSNKLPQNQQRPNYFRGRVIDPNNNPVPFANVTNLRDEVGTYTDAKGNFNLISPDSVLNVQVKSLGFTNNNVQLKNNIAANQVILQEDKSLSEVVISNKKPNAAARSHADNVKLEEPEPADGWDNYDTYLANNLSIPEEIKAKQTAGKVEVSFEIDKNGEPIKIKVEKSLCTKCDKEAIRLIKEGPKWKRKTKNGRTTVTIPF